MTTTAVGEPDPPRMVAESIVAFDGSTDGVPVVGVIVTLPDGRLVQWFGDVETALQLADSLHDAAGRARTRQHRQRQE